MTPPPRGFVARWSARFATRDLRRIVHGVFTSGAAMGIASALNYVVVIVLTRFATREDVGTFSYILSTATILATLADFGMTQTLTRSYHTTPPEDRKRLLAITLVTRGVLSALVGTVCLLSGLPDLGWVGILLFLWPGDSLILFLNARLDFNKAALLRLAAAVLYFGGALGLWLLFEDPGAAALARGGSFFLVGLFIAVRELDGAAFRGWRREALARLMRSGLDFFGLAAVSAILSNIDALLVKWMLSAEELGLYRPVYSLAILPTMLAMVTRIPLNAVVSSGDWSNRRRLLKTVHAVVGALVAISAVILLVGLVWGREILGFFLGDAYQEGAPIFSIILVTSLLSSAIAPYHSFIMMKGRPIVLTYLSVYAMALLIGLNLLLIPSLGIVGSAWARLATAALGAVLVAGHFYRGFLRGLADKSEQRAGEDEPRPPTPSDDRDPR